MSTATLYQWGAAACPVNIFMEVGLADRLRLAVVASDVEIGGFLVGHFEENKTIVADFELVESEHRRGAAYALSRRDDQHLLARIAASRKRRHEVVGFFRSHLRPGMFLDASDDTTLRAHFSNPQQVALLVKPTGGPDAQGGFFFWEDGEMNRKETRLTFPMQSAELDPVQNAPAAPEFDSADTLDGIPRSAALPPAPADAPPPAGKSNWKWIVAVAAGAALCGYFFGTSGNQEHFGSRPGDITINRVTEDPPPPPPAKQAASAPSPAVPQNVVPPPVPEPAKTPTVRVSQPKPQPHAVFEEMVRDTPPPEPAPTPPSPAAAPEPNPDTAGAFPHNPNPLPAPTVVAHTSEPTIDLESVQDGGIKQAIHRIHLFGAYRGGQDFHPPQVLRRTTPRVPADVSRGLTGEVPVDLKLKVDNTGRVSSVELISRGSDRVLVQLAGDAAYEWQFQPAQLKDRPVSSEVIAHFRFKP